MKLSVVGDNGTVVVSVRGTGSTVGFAVTGGPVDASESSGDLGLVV